MWYPLSEGFDVAVYALASYDDGAGSTMYAGGSFNHAEGLYVRKIACWRGSQWSPLGRAPDKAPYAFCNVSAWDCPRLFVGGGFARIGALRTGSLACWAGWTWSAGYGVPFDVHALTTFDDGSGLHLFIGGGPSGIIREEGEETLQSNSGIARGRMVEYDNGEDHYWAWQWSASPVSCDDAVCAFAAFQDVNEPQAILYAGGEFTQIGDRPAHYIARWNPISGTWEEVGNPNDPNHPQHAIYALAVYDPSNGPAALYAGGESGFYAWQNGSWAKSGTANIYALAVFDDVLYAGGRQGLWTWIGESLSAVPSITGNVFALQVFDDGQGPALYLAGWHPHADYMNHLLRWDGVAFGKVPGSEGPGDHVLALGTLPDGLNDRNSLYAGGHFLTTGNAEWQDTDSEHIARWGCGSKFEEPIP
jgi:hypothetical protein